MVQWPPTQSHLCCSYLQLSSYCKVICDSSVPRQPLLCQGMWKDLRRWLSNPTMPSPSGASLGEAISPSCHRKREQPPRGSDAIPWGDLRALGDFCSSHTKPVLCLILCLTVPLHIPSKTSQEAHRQSFGKKELNFTTSWTATKLFRPVSQDGN